MNVENPKQIVLSKWPDAVASHWERIGEGWWCSIVSKQYASTNGGDLAISRNEGAAWLNAAKNLKTEQDETTLPS